MSDIEIKRLPDAGDIVISTVKQVTGHGAYVTLDEFDNITGFLHISEIATGWIRNIERYVKPKQKIVLKVIRVDKTRSEVDLSLKQVSGEEKKSKIIDVKKSEKGSAFMDIIKTKLNLSNEDTKLLEEKILQKFDYTYDIFETVAKKGVDSISELDLSPEIVQAIEDESKKIPVQFYEIRGIFELSSKKPNGIDLIKNILSSIENTRSNSKIKITYVGCPRYRIVVTAENFKLAEKTLNNIVEKLKSSIEKNSINFNFIRQESKKTLQQSR